MDLIFNYFCPYKGINMQKHAIAEQYRGLYNKEIDSIIDEINIKFNTLLQLEETIPDDLGIKK